MARNLRNTIRNYLSKVGLTEVEASLILSLPEQAISDYLNKKRDFPKECVYRLVRLGINPFEFSVESRMEEIHAEIAQTVLAPVDAKQAYDLWHIPQELYDMFFLNKDGLYPKEEIAALMCQCDIDMPSIPLDMVASCWLGAYNEAKQHAEENNLNPTHLLKKLAGTSGVYEDVADYEDNCPSEVEDNLRDQIAVFEKKYTELQNLYRSATESIKALNTQISELEKQNKELYNALAEKTQEAHTLSQRVFMMEDSIKTIDTLKETVHTQEKTIQQLSEVKVSEIGEVSGNCRELYTGELDLFLTDAIEYYIDNHADRTRRKDLLNEYLSNVTTTDVEKTRSMLKSALIDMTEWMRNSYIHPSTQTFGDLVFIPMSFNNHIKFVLGGDTRYTYNTSSTPSDYRGAQNNVQEIKRAFL